MKYNTKQRKKKVFDIHTLREFKLRSRTLSYQLYLMALDGKSQYGYEAGITLANRVKQCAEVIEAVVCPTCGQIHSTKTWGCHHRLCPLCSLRESRATAHQARLVMTYLGLDQKYTYALLTFTQRNVLGEDLEEEIERLIAAWSSLRFLRDIRRHVAGWARTTEITVSSDGKTYHPHIHVILVLDKEAPEVMNGSDYWRKVWARALNLDYTPICDCRPVKDINAVYEVSKYITKVSKLLENKNPYTLYTNVSTIANAIYGRRLRSYGGIWAKARRNMAMREAEDMTDYELDQIETIDHKYTNCAACGNSETETMILLWSGMDYRRLEQ